MSADPTTMTDEAIAEEVVLIRENLREVPARSSYAERCKPRLRTLLAEQARRAAR